MPPSVPRSSSVSLSIRTKRVRKRVAISWTAPDDMDHPDWVAVGLSIGEMGRVSNWWVGDWLRYGTSRWGEKYVEAARITGLDGKTLRNLVYVASRFDLSRRRDKLTWSHHAEVAAIEPSNQDHWLDRSIQDRLSVADLRLELRSALRSASMSQTSADDPSLPDDESAPLTLPIVCPSCGHTIEAGPDPETPALVSAT